MNLSGDMLKDENKQKKRPGFPLFKKTTATEARADETVDFDFVATFKMNFGILRPELMFCFEKS